MNRHLSDVRLKAVAYTTWQTPLGVCVIQAPSTGVARGPSSVLRSKDTDEDVSAGQIRHFERVCLWGSPSKTKKVFHFVGILVPKSQVSYSSRKHPAKTQNWDFCHGNEARHPEFGV